MTKVQKKSVAEPQVTVSKVEYLTAKEAAAFIGVSINYFYKLTSQHKLPMYNPTGRKLLFKRSELDAWVMAARVSTDEELARQAELKLIQKGVGK